MRADISLTLGMSLALLGCLAIYLGAEHQRLVQRRWPAWPARIGGGLLLLSAAALLLASRLLPVTAAFLFCTWVMLIWVMLPYLGAYKTLRQARKKDVCP